MLFVRYLVFDEETKTIYLNDLDVLHSSGNFATLDLISPEALSRRNVKKRESGRGIHPDSSSTS